MGTAIKLHFLRDGVESGNFTAPLGSRLRFALEVPSSLQATEAKFYLGNDRCVLLREDTEKTVAKEGTTLFSFALEPSRLACEGAGLFFFHFEVETPFGRRYTVCEDNRVALADRFVNEFQLTVYSARYQAPQWLDQGVFYHIFVDRFCKSGQSERRGDAVYCDDWENGIPEYPPRAGMEYPNHTHFGGDLYGIIQKLPYLQDLGVTVLYLSPVCEAYSNHKYDTGDYLQVDPSFGGDDALRALFEEAHARGMHVILDGVFNHVGDDSVYFNRFGKRNSVGACQSMQSPYYPWFHFLSYPDTYECWWGIRNLPRTVKNASFRRFVCEQVIPKYMRMGADGFRLDVADELDSSFLEEIVAAVKAEKAEAAVIGEVWEDASNKIAYEERKRYFQGAQLDGVMNYPLRNGLIDFLREGDASLLQTVTETLFCHYPPNALAHTMNVVGTHDTERILTVLGGEPDLGEENAVLAARSMTSEQRAHAKQLFCCGYALLAALPGVPCIYYGDEVGMEGYHDPFNRRPFPWHSMDMELHAHVRRINQLRAREPLFAAKEFSVLESPREGFAFCREDEGEKLFVFSNRSAVSAVWQLDGEATDLLTGEHVSQMVTVAPRSTVYLHMQKS